MRLSAYKGPEVVKKNVPGISSIGKPNTVGMSTLECTTPNGGAKVNGIMGIVKNGIVHLVECGCVKDGICHYPGVSFGATCNAGKLTQKPILR